MRMDHCTRCICRLAGALTLGASLLCASGAVAQTVPDGVAATFEEGRVWVDVEAKPTLTVSWQDARGREHTRSMQLPYTEAVDRKAMASNLEAYVGVGGTRLEVGAGHPQGVIVRVGLYKIDTLVPMFGALDPATPITLRLDGVRFRTEGVPRPESIVQHLSYSIDDVVACGLTKEYVNMYNLASDEDTLNDRAIGNRGRAGVIRVDPRDFEGEEVDSRQAALAVLGFQPDGSVSLWASLPYQLLRHRGDPSRLDLPGTFFEPYNFHLEFEAVPADVASREFGLEREEVIFDEAATRTE